MTNTTSKTLVIGASENPARYSHKAVKMLRLCDHEVVAYGLRTGKILDTPIQTYWPEKNSILSHLDVLKTDAVEAEMLTGISDIREAARKISDLGPHEVVITHRDGLLVYTDGQFYEESFFPNQLIGRSGRGDTCIAAYIAKRLSASPQEAIIWAAAVTSLKMEAEGPFQRTIEDVNHLIQTKYRV